MRHWILTGAAALALALVAVPQVYAHGQGRGPFVDENGDGINDNGAAEHRFGGPAERLARLGIELTEEQAAAIQAQVDALKADGASREDIHAAVTVALGGFGIEMPTATEMVTRRFSDRLTEEQLATLQAAVEGLGEDATREDIRATVDATLQELGVERPALGPRGGGFDHHRGRGHRGRGRGPAPAREAAPDTN